MERRRFRNRNRNGNCRKEGNGMQRRMRMRRRDRSCLRNELKIEEKDMKILEEIFEKYDIKPGNGLGRLFQ